MAWTQALMRLQEVDREMRAGRQRLAEIRAALKETQALAQAKQRAEAASATARAARKAQETLEFELGQVQTKRTRTEQNLYGGRITNTRELQDLQAELQSLRRRISELEDQLLEAMMAREAADEAAATAAAHLQQVQADMEASTAALRHEAEELAARDAALHAEREKLRAQIPPSIVDSYDFLWDRTAGMPVAQLKGTVCGVCGTEVLRPTQRKVQRGEEAYCDTCGRLLVA